MKEVHVKHKVSELEGALLDAAVAKALLPIAMRLMPRSQWREGYEPPPQLAYSTEWAAGGPIIEREGIAVYRVMHGWAAVLPGEFGGYGGDRDYIDVQPSFSGERGETSLMAAMRAYVASKFGEEVELS
jgi:Protein of unknown function (DUF2591)